MEKIFCSENFNNAVNNIITSKIVIYGMGILGKALTSMLKGQYEVPYCIDRDMNGQTYADISIYDINHLKNLDRNVTIIITLVRNEEVVKGLLEREGFKKVIPIKSMCNSYLENKKI